jgi:hypothetical protein
MRDRLDPWRVRHVTTLPTCVFYPRKSFHGVVTGPTWHEQSRARVRPLFSSLREFPSAVCPLADIAGHSRAIGILFTDHRFVSVPRRSRYQTTTYCS